MSYNRAKTQQVDLGLAISGATLEPGQTRTLPEIAAYCGCSPQNIGLIEQSAMRKLRNKVLFSPELREELAAAFGSSKGQSLVRDHKRRTDPPIL